MRPPAPASGFTTDPTAVGLVRSVVRTSVGPVVVHAGGDRPGPALLLLHGAAASWTTWTPLLTAVRWRGQDVGRVVAVDLPGWGASPLPADPAFGVETMAAAVVEAVRAVGVDSWHVLGHSLGGFVAFEIAAAEPTATRSVEVVSTTGAGVIDAVRRPVRGGLRLPGFAGMLLGMRALAALGPVGTALIRGVRRVGLLPRLASPLFAAPRTVAPAIVAALADEIRPESFRRGARAAAAYDRDRWRRIRCPVHTLRGDRDVFVGAADATDLRSRVPHLTTARLSGAGHYAHTERPAALLRRAGDGNGSGAAGESLDRVDDPSEIT